MYSFFRVIFVPLQERNFTQILMPNFNQPVKLAKIKWLTETVKTVNRECKLMNFCDET